MYPRFTRAILILLILAMTVSVMVPAVPAAGTTRAVPAFAPATTTPAPVKTVTCAAPCQCLAYAGAVSLWGEGGFSQCAELPCVVSQSVTGARSELYCYRQKQPAVPTTTTPAQVLVPRGRITTIPTTVIQVLVPRNLTTTTPVPVQHQAVVPVNPSVRQVDAPLDLCHYDSAKNQCAGICPQTGKACMQISGSSCGTTPGTAIVKCGCADTKLPASVAASGLGQAAIVSQANYHYSPPQKGVVDSTVRLITGLVKQKPDLSTADPNQYTMDTTRFATARFPGACPDDLFRTTLIFADDDTAYISTETGSRKGSFSWDTADPRVRSAVWQVAVLPFPMSRDNWSNVPGLLAQGNLEGDERTFTIDFSKSVPTAADTASVWVNRNAFLAVQKNALTRVRADLAAGPADIPGINTAVSAAARQNMVSGLDNALVKINTRIATPAAYTMTSGLKTGAITGVSKDLADTAAPGGQVVDHSGKYLAKNGVYAPSLNVPPLSKAGVAGSLPQNQRTLFVRVVPFDQNGNSTNNPSNTKEVVIGAPRFNVSSPWSGWTVQQEPDQSGFANPPELVRFGNRLYQFNVRSDHLVYMSSVSDAGAVAGWTQVPGAPQTDKVVSAVEYRRVSAGRESSESHIYLFVTRQDTGHTWYSRMDTGGAWSVWKQVPQKDPQFTSTTGYHYTLEKALVLNKNLYLLAEYNYDYNHPNDMSFSHPSLSFMYQRMDDDQNEKWMNDWVDTSVGTSGTRGKIAGATSQFIVGAYQDGADQPHFVIYYPPRCADLCTAPYPKIVMDKLATINVPPEILNAKTSVEDLTATSYHGRLYFFVRGKNSHIYVNRATILNQLGSTQHLGSLHDWEDISPGQTALGSGITSLPSMEGDRLDIFADNIQKEKTDNPGGLGSYFSSFFTQQSGLHRNSLGGAPENTQVLASFSGEKEKQVGDIAMTGYGSRDINLSWSRSTPFWFAWNSSRPDLYYAEWQVSSAPFDEVNPKFDDKGIISRGRLSVSDADPDLATYGSGYFNGNALPEYTDKVHLFPVNFPGFGTIPDPGNPTVTPYYLRVLAVAPATGPGSFTAYASEQTEIDWGKQDEFVPKFCTPPTFYTYEYRLPQVSITGYTPIHPRDADADCHVIATTGHTYWKEQYIKNPVPVMLMGKATNDVNKDADAFATLMVGPVDYGWTKNVCTPPDDKSWWEKIIEGFKDLFELIASLVNNIADAYNGTKQVLIASICANDPACQTLVSAGVDIGLAALGVPPTLPNFDKLMDEGADYMAATLAEESGIPGSEIALKAGMHEMASSMKNVPSSHDAYGLQPDPEFQYRPARLSIELRNNDPVNTTPPGSFRFEDDWGLFRTMQPDTPFPSMAPGEVLTFPLILKEDQWNGVTCTESFAGGSEVWTVPCDASYPGQINKGWWEKYQEAADGGDSFTLYYDGMSANFTKSITSQMEEQYGVPLDTYKGDGWMQDYKSPDCFAEKHQLVFQATDNAGNKISYDPINRVYVDSLSLEWKA